MLAMQTSAMAMAAAPSSSSSSPSVATPLLDRELPTIPENNSVIALTSDDENSSPSKYVVVPHRETAF